MNKCLILGISGQDGSYLAKFLLEKGYKVFGSSRNSEINRFKNLKRLGIFNEVEKISLSFNDFRSIYQQISIIKPDEIYNLAGQTSVSLSFSQPVETLESIVLGNINLLESIRFSNLPIKYYNAGSSEIFGNTSEVAHENSILNPLSPYGVSKAAAYLQVKNYRDAYNLFATTGILFNHESPLRKKHFVTAKIINAVCSIHKGSKKKLVLGNLDITRDWGWSPEYVESMWRILQYKDPEDFVIGTGKSISLKEFVKYAFEYFNLNWKDYVKIDKKLFRPSDIKISRCNPSKAKKILNWKPKLNSYKLIEKLIECELNKKFI